MVYDGLNYCAPKISYAYSASQAQLLFGICRDLQNVSSARILTA